MRAYESVMRTCYRIDGYTSCVLQSSLEPLCWLTERLKEEVVQHWGKVCRDLQCTSQASGVRSMAVSLVDVYSAGRCCMHYQQAGPTLSMTCSTPQWPHVYRKTHLIYVCAGMTSCINRGYQQLQQVDRHQGGQALTHVVKGLPQLIALGSVHVMAALIEGQIA